MLVKLLVDAKRLKLLRYSDPVLGPRKLPNFENVNDDKLLIEASDTFRVDTDSQVVTLQSDRDCSIAIGSQLVYVISS